jgi:plastocyanin
VHITKQGFSPETVTIKAGQTVRWINSDNTDHEVVTDPSRSKQPKVFSEKPLGQNDSFTVKFEDPGAYPYYDPQNATTFKATVIVE